MLNRNILSDQLSNWSEYDRLKRLHFHPTPSAPSSGQTSETAPTPYPSWLSDRTLQTVRQALVQMPTRPRTWTKILLIGQPAWRPTSNGLYPRRAPSTGLRLFAELPESAQSAGADLFYQPRVVAASSEVLTHCNYGASTFFPNRSRISWGSCRQFFAELATNGLCTTCGNSKKGDF